MVVDLNIINPFITGAVETFKVQGSLEVEAGKPFLKGRQAQPPFAIAGSIGVLSDQFKGAVTLCFEEKFFLEMMSNMLGEPILAITEETQDGAAEALNIIYGMAKTSINAKSPGGLNLQKAIPTVIRGEKLQALHDGSTPTIVIPIRVASGAQCHIEISVDMS